MTKYLESLFYASEEAAGTPGTVMTHDDSFLVYSSHSRAEQEEPQSVLPWQTAAGEFIPRLTRTEMER